VAPGTSVADVRAATVPELRVGDDLREIPVLRATS
jgi:hypothetical protein